MSERIDSKPISRAHAKLSASGSSRWLNCPGSVKAEEGYPNEQSIYAAEGTLAHELADMALKNEHDADFYIGKKILNKIIKKDMADYVQEYLDYVRSFITNNCQFYTEERVDFSNVVPEGFGTLDAAVVDYDARVCHIFDLKYGQGVSVSAIDNSQGKLYAIGLLNELGFMDAFDKFVIHIGQPRKNNFSAWEISVVELEKWAKWVNERALLAISGTGPRVPGEDQCKWCKAKSDCPALFKFTQEVIGCEFDNLDDEALEHSDQISDEQKRIILNSKSLIISFLESIEQDVEKRLLDGKEFPGYKLIIGRSNRKFTDDAEFILEKELGDKAFKKSLIGVTAAEKLLGKDKVSKLVYKPDGKPKLVTEDTKGKPYVSAADIFDDLDENGEV